MTHKKDKVNTDYWRKKIYNTCTIESFVPKSQIEASEIIQVDSFDMPGELFDKLVKASSGNKLGVYCICLSAYYTLLYKWYGHGHVAIASGGIEQKEDSRDYFNLNLSTVQADDQFKDLIIHTNKTIAEQKAYQEIDEVQINKLISGLFEGQALVPKYGVFYENVTQFDPSSTVPFVLKISEKNGALNLALQVHKNTLAPEFIYFLHHYVHVIELFFENTSITIGELNTISAEENKALSKVMSGASVDYEVKTFLNLFAESCSKFSTRTAVSFGNAQLNYGELDELSDRLAEHLLDEHQLIKGERAAIMMNHSEWLPVSVIGVLKTGSAFVPIDPNYPQARIQQIIDDSQVALLLTDGQLYFELSNIDIPMVAVDIQLPTLEPSREVLSHEFSEDNTLAYILYTSGTTGTPKGVAVSHASLGNYLNWSNGHYFKSKEGKVFGWFTPLSFDLSLTGILGTLCRGDELKIYSTEDPGYALQHIFSLESGVTSTKITPSHIGLLAGLEVTNPGGVKALIVGGEAFKSHHFSIIEKLDSGIKVYNEYGPTEATIGCTVKQIESSSSITIGKPINNSSIHILNHEGHLSPWGLNGEIAISGDVLATGYWNNEQETLRRFVTTESGIRLYKTGDLGCWNADGELVYKGRIDEQLKVRGYRIEPQEISKTLEKLDTVSSVLIREREVDGTVQGLVGYYIGTATDDELRSYALQELPSYMVPEFFIAVNDFPINANGKVDYSKLPSWQVGQTLSYEAPRNENETLLAEVFSKVLQIDNVGIHDNFFQAGGDSIKAIQIIARISKELGIKLEVKDIFDQPTVATLGEYIKGLSTQAESAIKAIEEQEYYNASHGQQRLWVLDQFKDEQIAYNQDSASIISGELDIEACVKAFEHLVKRHESLRTTFLYIDQQLKQKINAFDETIHSLLYVDLRGEEDKEELVQKMVHDQSQTPFDLINGPLVRGNLYQVYDDKYVLYMSTHHIVSDGWSWGILRNDLTRLYYGYKDSVPMEMPEIEVHFKEYTAHMQDWKTMDGFEESKRFWNDKLEGPLPVLDLPTYQTRPPIQTFNGQSLEYSVDLPRLTKLKQLGQESESTLFIVLISILNLLFHKYTRQTDIILGTDAASRTHEELEQTIGFFLDSIVLRTTFEKEDTFKELINNVKKVVLDGFKHQQYPFDNLVEDLGLQRDLSRTPLFDVLVIMQVKDNNLISGNTENPSSQGVESSGFGLQTTSSLVDLEFNFNEYDQGMDINVRYNTDLFKESQIIQLLDCFINLVDQVVQQPEESLSGYSLLTKEEQLPLIPLSQGAEKPTSYENILEALNDSISKSGENTALLFRDQVIDYISLDEMSNRIAHFLIETHQIKPGAGIGIFADPSNESIPALIGILKAGCVFVPLDKNLPESRLIHMIEDAGIKLVLSDIEVDLDIDTFSIQLISEALKCEDKAHKLDVKKDDVAYIMYTSGSTGNPKGVMISHEALLDYALSFSDYFQLDEGDMVIQQSSFSFDTSIEEIFPILISGGKLLILPDEKRKNVNELLEVLKEHHPSILSITPSFINELKDHTEELSQLKALISGGEELKPEHYGNLWKVGNLYNSYGPTESTVCVTYYKISSADDHNIIGSPMNNHSVYILSDELQMLPVGVEGEICVSGAGLSRGYLNLPELNESKFVQNPFDTGERLYRTGDLGRWTADATIVYTGRKDDQIKINGYRIEPGEVEHNLLNHDSVKNACVIVTDSGSGTDRMVAFVESDEEIDFTRLEGSLREVLPAFMIPAVFLKLDQFPTTISGKINRSALIKEYNKAHQEMELKHPVNDTQLQVLEMWKTVLKLEEMGINQNFFELGGHSLRATRLVNEITKHFGVVVNLNAIFQHPTIEQLSEYIDALLYVKNQPEKKESNVTIQI